MNCQEIDFMLETVPAEALSVEQRNAVDIHFSSCDSCRAAWAAYRRIAATNVPPTPRDLRLKVAATLTARAPFETRPLRRSLAVGGLLVAGAAAAAAIAVRVADRALDLPAPSEETVPAVMPAGRPASNADPGALSSDPQAPDAEAPPASSRGTPEAATDTSNNVGSGGSIAKVQLPNDSTATGTDRDTPYGLDPLSVVVLAVPEPAAEATARAEFATCRNEVIRQLTDVAGLNVIADQRTAAFDDFDLPETLARELGAGNVLVLTMVNAQASCNARLLDSQTGVARSGRLVFVDPQWTPDRWTSFAASVVDGIADATLTDSATVIANARATVLDTALDDRERASAFFELRGRGAQARAAYDAAIIAAAAEIAMTSSHASARQSAIVAMREMEDPYLVAPLLHVLANDDEDDVRRAAAYALNRFLDEPGVRDALMRAEAEDPSAERPVPCCISSVREAARRALMSDDELRDAILGTVMDEALTDGERLEPLVGSPDGRGLAFTLSDEAARAVFEIGRGSDGSIRSQAWTALARADRNTDFVQTLLDDLAGHANEGVRTSAAHTLTKYVDDPAVKAGLERALAEDPSRNLRWTLRRTLSSSTAQAPPSN